MQIPSIVLTMQDLRSMSEPTFTEIMGIVAARTSTPGTSGPMPEFEAKLPETQRTRRQRRVTVTRDNVLAWIQAKNKPGKPGVTTSMVSDHFAGCAEGFPEAAQRKKSIRHLLNSMQRDGLIRSKPLEVRTGRRDRVTWHIVGAE